MCEKDEKNPMADINNIKSDTKKCNEQIEKSIGQISTKLDNGFNEIKESNKKITQSLNEINKKLNTIDCKHEKIKKYIDNICKWKNCLWGGCIVLVLFIIGLIACSICCASKVQTTTENNSYIIGILNTITKSMTVPWNNTPYFFLFLIACLGLIGGIIFLLCTYCREKTKQALLTYAYDEALEKLEEDRNKHMYACSNIFVNKDTNKPESSSIVLICGNPKKDIDSKTQKETNESTQGQAQNPKPIEETITMNRYYKKAVTKIFETYCQNITSK